MAQVSRDKFIKAIQAAYIDKSVVEPFVEFENIISKLYNAYAKGYLTAKVSTHNAEDVEELRDDLIYWASFDIWGCATTFEEATRPVIHYLCEHKDPHTTILITPTTAELLSGEKSLGIVTDYVKD